MGTPYDTAQTAAKPSLAGFGNFLGVSHITDPNQEGAQEYLGRLQQYDPNAKWVDEGNLGENPDNHQWRLQYDNTKLPVNPTGAHGTFGVADVAPMQRDNGTDSLSQYLIKPTAVRNDPVYGHITPTQNVKTPKDNGFWQLMRIAPQLAFAISTAGASLPAQLSMGALQAIRQYGSTGKLNPWSVASLAAKGAGLGGP